MIAPTTLNLTAYQGATFTYSFTWTADGVPVDLTGYTARMQVRPTVNSASVELDFVSGNGIALGGVTGVVTISADATEMSAVDAGTYVYDLEMDSGGEVTRLIQGTFTIEAGVTR